ncbi:MAG: acetyl-CoA acetyltransferase [Actinomycetota bacterium]|nr:acetyl-CoA acetyltransferase [Actinomycetota bacterium]
MGSGVAVVGIGWSGFARATPEVSYKELMFAAARSAYEDAGVDPRRDVDSFVCCSEDFLEGTSIFDEYVPDQLGAAQRPVQTVSGDGLFGLATAEMLLRSGVAQVVAVEAHSKASNVVTLGAIEAFAMDPVLNRPLSVSTLAVAGLEMSRFLEVTDNTEEQCAEVARRNREAALANPRAAYGSASADEEEPLYWPLRTLDVAEPADGCVVIVLANEERAKSLSGRPVSLLGTGWSSGTPTLESRDWDRADSVERAGTMAIAAAGSSGADVDVAEVDDTYTYKELQHLEALGFAGRGTAGSFLANGVFERTSSGVRKQGPVVNPSGGSLGQGNLFEANGLARVLECVQQLRGDAGQRQVEGARVALAQSWRGVPTTSAAVAIFGEGA